MICQDSVPPDREESSAGGSFHLAACAVLVPVFRKTRPMQQDLKENPLLYGHDALLWTMPYESVAFFCFF